MTAFSLSNFIWGAVKVMGGLCVLAFFGGLLTGMGKGLK